MKIIFLDFDGVLNSMTMTDQLRPSPDACSPTLVERLHQIVRLTKAKIVISSSWRHYHSTEWLEGFLSAHGLPRDLLSCRHDKHIIDATPSKLGMGRGEDINLWLAQYQEQFLCGNHPEEWTEVESYVILDDDSSGMHLHGGHFVQVDPEVGLSRANMEQAIRILSKENEQ